MTITCTCGSEMRLSLRTLIYSSKVEINNVPIYTCECCHRSEVFSAVKGDLTPLIEQIADSQDEPSKIRFDECNELAFLLMKASDQELLHESLMNIIEERINELLDMLLLAKSLNDPAWVEDLRGRLRQISDHYVISGTLGRDH